MTLPTLTKVASELFRDFNTTGMSGTGDFQPYKPDLRTYFGKLEAALNALFNSETPMLNGKVVLSVAANALTITIKTATGNDPSAADPVYVHFRSATDTDGGWETIELTAAVTPLVLASGSLMGTENGKAFALWIVAINDNGTFRLGAINRMATNVPGTNQYQTFLYPLSENVKQQATAEGTGAADSSGVIYAPVAVGTARPVRILARAVWDSGQAAAGVWATAPTRVVQAGPGMPKPGDLMQSVSFTTGATVSPGTTTTPYDDTIPQSGEGNEVLSQAITPHSAANLLKVSVNLWASYTVVAHLIAALHQDAIASALAAQAVYVGATNAMVSISFQYYMRADVVVATTFKIRIGGSTAGTPRLNGASGARLLGGGGVSSIQIEEIVT